MLVILYFGYDFFEFDLYWWEFEYLLYLKIRFFVVKIVIINFDVVMVILVLFK